MPPHPNPHTRTSNRKRGFIGSNDVSLAQTWLRDLTRVGYRFPLTEAEHVAAATGRKPLSRV